MQKRVKVGARAWLAVRRVMGLGLPGVILALGLVGCGGGGSNGADNAARCLQRKPSTTTGVYGCVTSSDDVGPPEPPQALPNFTVDAFDTEPSGTPDDGLVPVATSKSDEVGFFEIALSPGTHWLCTAFRRCMQVEVIDGTALPLNYDFGGGPGW